MSACRFDSSTHYQYPRPHPPRPQARDETRQLTVALQIRMNTSEPTASKARLPQQERRLWSGATPARHKTMHQLIKEEALRAALQRFYAAQSDSLPLTILRLMRFAFGWSSFAYTTITLPGLGLNDLAVNALELGEVGGPRRAAGCSK